MLLLIVLAMCLLVCWLWWFDTSWERKVRKCRICRSDTEYLGDYVGVAIVTRWGCPQGCGYWEYTSHLMGNELLWTSHTKDCVEEVMT